MTHGQRVGWGLLIPRVRVEAAGGSRVLQLNSPVSATRDQAICLRHWDFSETSQTVSLLTRAHGVVRGLAKGSRRPGSPFSGGIELLTLAEVAFIIKPSTELALVTEWDLTRSYPALRTDLHLYHAALYAGEIAQLMVRDQDPHPQVFDALAGALGGLTDATRVHAELLVYHWRLLRGCGFELRLDVDVVTGAALPSAGVVQFAPDLGGFTVDRAAHAGERWPARVETLSMLRKAASGTAIETETAAVIRAGALLSAFVRHLLGAPARTASLVYPPRR